MDTLTHYELIALALAVGIGIGNASNRHLVKHAMATLKETAEQRDYAVNGWAAAVAAHRILADTVDKRLRALARQLYKGNPNVH